MLVVSVETFTQQQDWVLDPGNEGRTVIWASRLSLPSTPHHNHSIRQPQLSCGVHLLESGLEDPQMKPQGMCPHPTLI